MLLVSTDDPQTDVKRRSVHETGSRKVAWLVWYSIGLSAFSKCWVDRHQGLIKSLSCPASFLAGVILSAKASLLGQAVDARIQGCIDICSSVRCREMQARVLIVVYRAEGGRGLHHAGPVPLAQLVLCTSL